MKQSRVVGLIDLLGDLGVKMTGHCLMCGETGCNGCDIVERLRAAPETGADPDMIFEAANEIERLRNAIERALADSESGNGWGPDVTVCAYLREALSPNAKVSRRSRGDS